MSPKLAIGLKVQDFIARSLEREKGDFVLAPQVDYSRKATEKFYVTLLHVNG